MAQVLHVPTTTLTTTLSDARKRQQRNSFSLDSRTNGSVAALLQQKRNFGKDFPTSASCATSFHPGVIGLWYASSDDVIKKNLQSVLPCHRHRQRQRRAHHDTLHRHRPFWMDWPAPRSESITTNRPRRKITPKFPSKVETECRG